MLRAANATFIPSLLNSLASDALNPGPLPTINAISCCAMAILQRPDIKMRLGCQSIQ
jgi:hypothetical protein